MTEELKRKAENFIIKRYKIAETYREDNEETREYMRIDVHSQYEEEYQLYLDATKKLQKQNEILAKHILELQADKGRLTDENRQAKEIIREYVNFPTSNDELWELHNKAEAFLKE